MIHDEHDESCHCHEHEHEHTHEHTHEDGTVHSHEHSHTHSHEHVHPHTHAHVHGDGEGHCHSHGEQGGTASEQTVALLRYMLGHNRDHTEEIHQLAHRLEAEGLTEQAACIFEGVEHYAHGNEHLAKALEMLTGE